MPRSMLFEENDDGTITMTLNLVDDEPNEVFIVPHDFDSLFAAMSPGISEETMVFAQENVIHVPNSPEED